MEEISRSERKEENGNASKLCDILGSHIVKEGIAKFKFGAIKRSLVIATDIYW